LKLSSLFAAGLPFGPALADGAAATKWPKPQPPFGADESWPNEAWEAAYRPDEFVFLKPSAQLVGTNAVAFFWKSRAIAYGWAEVSQDGGATWTKVWGEQDGVCDANTLTHVAVFTDYDPTKPLKYRTVTRPIAAFSRWGNVRFVGETLPENALTGYYVDMKSYKALVKERAAGYKGVEYVDAGELAPALGETFDIVMFNDTHHGIQFYPALLDNLGLKRASLAVFAGDICDHSRSEADFDKHLAAPMTYLTQRLGCLTRFVRGNHELMGLYARHVRNHVALQDNAFYGAATVGDTRLLFLDTAADVVHDPNGLHQNFLDPAPYFRRQGDWLRRELASSEWKEAKRHIAFSHIPPRYRKIRPSKVLAEALMDPLKDAKLTLFCAGHEHDGSFHPPIPEQPYPLVVGGGPYEKNNAKGTGIQTVTHLSVGKDAIAIRQVDLNGTVTVDEGIS